MRDASSSLLGVLRVCLNMLQDGNGIALRSYDAYRKQQHRWSCGPMQLWRKSMNAICASGCVPAGTRFYLMAFFFFVRCVEGHPSPLKWLSFAS